MQYLLTEEEYKSLIDKVAKASKLPDIEKLQEFCTMVADNLPLKELWGKPYGDPWGCILTKESTGLNTFGYCDKCPAQDVCPYKYKNWSQ